MIFITVGSRSFQFDRLLKAVDSAVENGEILDEIFAQVGTSTYQPKNYKSVAFLNQEEFNNMLERCTMVLTHGGTGVIINALKKGKRVVAVPRRAKYKEAVDDHQIQLIEAFEKKGMVTACYDCGLIGTAINNAKEKRIVQFESNTHKIIDSIDEMIIMDCSNNKSIGKKIRVLMCGSARNEKGGMNSVVDQLMDHDWGNLYSFTYLATHITGNRLKKSLFFTKSYLMLRKMARKNEFDIAHLHMSYKGSFYRKYFVTKLCKKYGKKVIIHLHGSEFENFYKNGKSKTKKMIKQLFAIADVTIVLGEHWKQFVSSVEPKTHIVVVNNSVNIPAIQEKKLQAKRTFLYLGALIKRKGVLDLLTAVNKLVNEGVLNIELMIAGAGEEEEELRRYVENNKISDYVSFLGWVSKEHKPDLFAKSDVLVLPSYNEGLPIAILEAMSYGLPIVSTNVGSISEAVQTNGMLVEAGDIDALAKCIKELSCNKEKYVLQSKESRKIAAERFSEESFFEKLEHIYRYDCNMRVLEI